jgi:uncharacterized repeat protein (TIGR03803 family)
MRTFRHLLAGGTLLVILVSGSAVRAASPIFDSLYLFSGGSDGSTPIAPVTVGNGVLYGTTSFGGPKGFGTVFSLTPPSTAGPWTETVLHAFSPSEGFSPFGSVVIDSTGVLYGTTYVGGPSKSGTVFSLTPPASPGGTWTEATLHAFSGTTGAGSSDGGYPNAPVVIGSGGVLYGTTTYGGAQGLGTVFSLTPPSSPGGSWTETVLHNFGGTGDGTEPIAGLVIGGDGTLYGTTFNGGNASSNAGAVFSVTPPAMAGGHWTEKVLYRFSGGNDGGTPYYGSLVMDSAGVLYGTTYTGGPSLKGTVFSLTPPSAPGSAWTEAVLFNFVFPSGKLPLGGLAIDSTGNLFGTTSGGGSQHNSAGTVFRLAPPATPGGAWKYTVIHSFTYTSSEGEVPYAGVVLGPHRVLFGTTSGLNPFGTGNGGTVFAVKP